MTIRWKLNFAILAVIAVFLCAAAFTMWAVSRNAERTRAYSRMRDSAQFTADLRTQIHQYLSSASSAADPEVNWNEWLHFAREHVDVQMRLAERERERELWSKVSDALAGFRATSDGDPHGLRRPLVARADRHLQALRGHYDLEQSRSIVETAGASLLAQAAIGIACAVTVLLFLIYLYIVRNWLVRPVEVLKRSAEIIGHGNLDHRVPLRGSDELAQLARRLDAMAEGLARHQAELLKARELSTLGELCANVAHGLRNPLAALRASIQLAEKRSGSVEFDPLLAELSHEIDRMDQRITRLFQFSRPLDLRPRGTTFAELARAAHAQAYPLLHAREVAVDIDDRTGDAFFRLDCERCAEMLAELLTNAAHHSPPGAPVRLAAEILPPHNGTGPQLQIRVADHGAGMSTATVQKAFDLFFTSRPEGTGMGLALVRRFVERSGGGVQLNSTLGEGTTVTVLMPAPLASAPVPMNSALTVVDD